MECFMCSIGTVVTNLFCASFAEGVLGYIDPGTGSFIIQMPLAVLFGGLVAIKLFWNNIKIFFKKLLSKEEERGKGE